MNTTTPFDDVYWEDIFMDLQRVLTFCIYPF